MGAAAGIVVTGSFHATVPASRDRVSVGMLGYGFMAKAHTNAYRTIPYIFWPNAPEIRLRAIAGRTETAVADAASRFGFEGYYLGWEELVEDAEIDLFDNCGPHSLHVEPTIAAIEAGKHVLCEKPLALTAEGAWRILEATQRSGVKVMAGFNYRFLPAVRLAYDLVRSGRLGTLTQCRIQYLQQGHHDPKRPLTRAILPEEAEAGALASLGSHAIDLARFLIGDIATVSALTPRFADERIGVDGVPTRIRWDDATVALVEFEHGAVGTIEASRVATGRRNALRFEIHGSAGRLAFDLERLNELEVYIADGDEPRLLGTREVLVTDPAHPYGGVWWPTGHVLGWEHAHANELHHFVSAVSTGGAIGPYGATADDGYRAAVVADAIALANHSRSMQNIAPRQETAG